MKKLKFFEKVYPTNVANDQHIYYYDGELFFCLSTSQTNIPKKIQRHFMVPATNPKYAGKYTSVKSCIEALHILNSSTLSIRLKMHPEA